MGLNSHKHIGIIGHGGIGRSSMQAAMIHSLMMQKGIKVITAAPEHEVIDQRGGVLTKEDLERASKIEPDAFSGQYMGMDLADGMDRGVNIMYIKNEDGTMQRIGTTTDSLPAFRSSLSHRIEDEAKTIQKAVKKLEVQQASYHGDYSRSTRNIRRQQERDKKKRGY